MSLTHQTDLLQSISQACSRIPYLDHGRDYDGADCWGLVYLVYRDFFNVELDTYNEDYDVNRQQDVHRVIDSHLEDFEQVSRPKNGDIVVVRILGRPWHCGIYFSPRINIHHMLHTQKGIGVTFENLNSTKWSKRIEGFYRPCS